jgi:hypothetical protein
MPTVKRQFLDAGHHESATEQKQRDMLHKIEEFLHAYYDLLEETGGPPNKYRPQTIVNDGMDKVEQLWWKSLDDDG